MNCQWRMGMLTMRECGAPAGSGCASCGMTLCGAHAVMGPNGPACPQCASSQEGYGQTEDTEFAASRQEFYQPYGGVGGFGRQGFFSRSDSASMNRPASAPAQRQAEYDAMES